MVNTQLPLLPPPLQPVVTPQQSPQHATIVYIYTIQPTTPDPRLHCTGEGRMTSWSVAMEGAHWARLLVASAAALHGVGAGGAFSRSLLPAHVRSTRSIDRVSVRARSRMRAHDLFLLLVACCCLPFSTGARPVRALALSPHRAACSRVVRLRVCVRRCVGSVSHAHCILAMFCAILL